MKTNFSPRLDDMLHKISLHFPLRLYPTIIAVPDDVLRLEFFFVFDYR